MSTPTSVVTNPRCRRRSGDLSYLTSAEKRALYTSSLEQVNAAVVEKHLRIQKENTLFKGGLASFSTPDISRYHDLETRHQKKPASRGRSFLSRSLKRSVHKKLAKVRRAMSSDRSQKMPRRNLAKNESHLAKNSKCYDVSANDPSLEIVLLGCNADGTHDLRINRTVYQPFGIYIKETVNDKGEPRMIVTRLISKDMHRYLLNAGDEIVMVNDMRCSKLSLDDIQNLARECLTLTLRIRARTPLCLV